jgi:hypothetical protein
LLWNFTAGIKQTFQNKKILPGTFFVFANLIVDAIFAVLIFCSTIW